MSLSRNGTLEKTVSEQAHSERGSPSRAGSGVVVPPPYSLGGSEAADTPLELRGSLDCWACSVLVTAQNLVIALINAGLASIVFGTILTPALTMIIFGFLCHSTVRISWKSLLLPFFLTDRLKSSWSEWCCVPKPFYTPLVYSHKKHVEKSSVLTRNNGDCQSNCEFGKVTVMFFQRFDTVFQGLPGSFWSLILNLLQLFAGSCSGFFV